MRASFFAWSHFRTENRFPPRIKSGAGFFPENALFPVLGLEPVRGPDLLQEVLVHVRHEGVAERALQLQIFPSAVVGATLRERLLHECEFHAVAAERDAQ